MYLAHIFFFRIGIVHTERWGRTVLLWYECDQDKYIFDVYGNLFTRIHIFCLCFSISFFFSPFFRRVWVMPKYIYDSQIDNTHFFFASYLQNRGLQLKKITFLFVKHGRRYARKKHATDFRFSITYLNVMNYSEFSFHSDRSAIFRWICH